MSTGCSGTGVAETDTPAKGAIQPDDTQDQHQNAKFLALLIGSVGVVYGDIGTSPLYAFREAMLAAGATTAGAPRDTVLGLVSLILWALTIVVTLKYIVVLLRADNDGEGGTLSLMALAQRAMGRRTNAVFLLGIIGAALFYGDALITPAISVLSAVEGLKLVHPATEHVILPITLAIIVGLFAVQNRGTAAVAKWFGPITLVWFIAMAVGGLLHIADDPGVFAALNPLYAVHFMLTHGMIGLVALGAVFLAVTGAEALYADLGHFGKKPIRVAWVFIVCPALALNYLGQGAMVLADPEKLESPFFLLFPRWALLPVVVLATLATIIASQAVITGAFSLTRQAIQLRLLPRLEIRHTSADQEGQIYMPQVNYLLMIGVLALVVLFGSSSKLATAYGIAVTGTMLATASLAFIVVWRRWNWPLWAAICLMAPFGAIDLIFFSANALKILEGGYVPLLVATCIMLCMWTWVRGSGILAGKVKRTDVPLAFLVEKLGKKPPQRVPGLAVFMTAEPDTAPSALLHSLKHYKVLHEKNAILTIRSATVPRVAEEERIRIETIDDSFQRVTLRFGYMEEPNVPKALAQCRKQGMKFDIMSTSFFLSRRSIRPSAQSGMPVWQDKLFIAMAHNASDASAYFHIPTDRVVEIGAQITV
ncbi:MAG: potassium transporter Kup [Beijerinckiaceae bacterium]|nr:potassium transporter Kup [Beijerinckiaceae bacterium]